jgi:hypothetical protein
MRIDVELFTSGEAAEGALLVSAPLPAGLIAEVHRHPRAGQSANGPTHEVRLVIPAAGIVMNDVALWKKTSQAGAEYLNGALLKGGNWWVSVNYLDQDAPSGAVAKLTVRHSPPKQQDAAAGAGSGSGDDFWGRF